MLQHIVSPADFLIGMKTGPQIPKEPDLEEKK